MNFIRKALLSLTPFFSNKIKYSYTLKPKPNKKPQVPFKRWNIVRGDIVQVIAGKDKGKVGRVTKVLRKLNKITVRGVNIKTKKTQSAESLGVVFKKKSYPIHVSNAGLYDNVAKKAVRIRYGFHPQTGQKLRISKATGRILLKPVHKKLTRERRGRKRVAGKKDTTVEFVHKVTYEGQDFEAIRKEFQAFIKQKQAKQKYLVFKQ